jgi:enediyne biosynthesis protein E4
MSTLSLPVPRRWARRIVALLAVVIAYVAAQAADRHVAVKAGDVSGRFAFSREILPGVPGPTLRSFHRTHPDLHHLAGFLSTLGASAALTDLDGDGLPNDACYVDTRTDQVIVAPAPGTGQRYRPFALQFVANGVTLFDRDRMAVMGCLPGDLDEDGRMDLVVYFIGRTPILLLARATPDGSDRLSAETFLPVDIIPGGAVWTTGSATLADLDGDGHLELIVANYFGDGIALFDAAGKTVVPNPMPDSFSRAFNGGGLRIFRCRPTEGSATGGVACTEVTDALPDNLPRGWGLAVAAYDIDNDLLPELYVANDFGPDRFLWNRSSRDRIRFQLVEGEFSIRKPRSLVLGRDSFKGMGVDFGDLNGDGIPDFMVSNITSRWMLHEAQTVFIGTGANAASLAKGLAPYVESSEAMGLARSGWAWDVKFDDFDNDGSLEVVQALGFLKGAVNRWPELQELGTANDALASRPRFWAAVMPGDDLAGHERNAFYMRSGNRYVDIGAEIGFGEDDPSRGIAVADVDGDGKLDMVVAKMWALPTYFHNECRQCGTFLGLHLRLPAHRTEASSTVIRSGHPDKAMMARPAIGATVTVTTPDGRSQTRQVDGGNGHAGKRSPDLHFGLGREAASVQVQIEWRDNHGNVHEESHRLDPGWHTLLLGSRSAAAALD